MRKSVFALLLGTLVSGSAVAAESANLTVTGTIRPAACELNLSGGGAVEYGTISAQDLISDGYKLLDMQELDISIRCDSPARVGVKAINGRPYTVAGGRSETDLAAAYPDGVESLAGITGGAAFGLGTDTDGRRIGGYQIRLISARIDNTVPAPLESIDDLATWRSSAGSLASRATAKVLSWENDSSGLPSAWENMTGKLRIQAYLNKRSELDISQPVALNGFATLELVYL